MKQKLFSIIYMFVITLLFTSIVSGVKVINEERINRNQNFKRQKIILKTLDILKEEVPEKQLEKIYNDRVKTITVNNMTIYTGYATDTNAISGYAFPVNGSGFWGPIYGMAAVGPDASKIKGVAFYKHSETPGLGARITEKWFTDQFIGLPMSNEKDESKIFYLKPEGTGSTINELDAITGATGTSMAVETFLNSELTNFRNEIWTILKEKAQNDG